MFYLLPCWLFLLLYLPFLRYDDALFNFFLICSKIVLLKDFHVAGVKKEFGSDRRF